MAPFRVHAISFRVLGLHIHGPSRYIRRRHSSSEGVPAHLVGGQVQRNDALTPLERKRDIVAQKKNCLWKRFRTSTEGHETAGCYVQGDWKKWKDLEITI